MSDQDRIETVLETIPEEDEPTPEYAEVRTVESELIPPEMVVVTEPQIFSTTIGAGDGPQVHDDAEASIAEQVVEPFERMAITAERADIIVHMTMDGEKVRPMACGTEEGPSKDANTYERNPVNQDRGDEAASENCLIGYTASEHGPDNSDMTDNEDGAWGLSSSLTELKLPPLPLDRTLKHPIAMAWTLWMFERNGGSWLNNQVEIATFDTIEDFWMLYSHMKLPGDLQNGCDYAIFREGTKPMWEDVNNAGGGRWIVPFSTTLRNNLLNQCWIHVVIAVLGESFPQTHEICGVVINIREKRDKIAIWTKCARRDRNNKAIGRYLKEVLHVSSGLYIKYFAHCDAQTPQKFLYCL